MAIVNAYDGSNKAISFDGVAVNIAVGNYLYNVGWKSGFSSGITAKSGSLASNSNGLNPCVYRGIENPWGSIYQCVDGVNIAADYQAWVCATPASYASNLFASPYEVLSYANGNTSGYTEKLGFDTGHPYAQFPITIGGNSLTYYSDYYYCSAGNRIAFLGGGGTSGANAGAFYWYLSYASSYTYLSIGGRLVRKAA